MAYATAPLSADTTVVGAGGVDLWVRSSTPNVDLQATISEVRPDGKETFVQGGWVRGNMRKLDAAKSTLLEPVLSLREADVSPMPTNSFAEVTIPLYYQGHMYRAGSRIRVQDLARPTATSRSGRSARPSPPDQARGRDRLRRQAGRRASSSRWCRAWARRPGCRRARACAASRAATTSPSRTARGNPKRRCAESAPL